MLRLSSKFDFELPRSQGKNEDVVSYISIGVRKEETHRLLRGSLGEGRSVMGGWCPQHPCPCALKEFPRQFFMPRVGESQERDIGKQLGNDASAESLGVGQGSPRGGGGRVSPPAYADTAKCSVHGISVVTYPGHPVPHLAHGQNLALGIS